MLSEGVRTQNEVLAGVFNFKPCDESSEHPPAHTATLVFRSYVDGPEIQPRLIAKVYRDAPDGSASFTGNEVAVRAVFICPCQHRLRSLWIFQISQIEGVERESALAPMSHLMDQVLVPRPQLKLFALNDDARR